MANMIDLATALYNFWNGFGITAYPNEPPETAELPYIVYNVNKGQTLNSATDFVKIFWEGKNTRPMLEVADKINAVVGDGVTIPVGENGNIIIWQAEIQNLPDTDTTSALYLNFTIDYNV